MGVLIILLFVCHVTFLSARSTNTPIVIIPGFGGSQIDAKLDRETVDHKNCQKTSDWYRVWVNASAASHINCFIDNFKMEYNAASGKMQDQSGVSFNVPGFGDTDTIEYLNPGHLFFPVRYFHAFVKHLVKSHDYERGLDIRAAPYDFRRDPSMAQDYMVRLKGLIEDTYIKNGYKPVMLITHSMGSPYTLHFLHSVSKEWKVKYIKAWTSISGAFAGSVMAVQGFISGVGLEEPAKLLEPLISTLSSALLKLERTLPGLAFLLPDVSFWKDPNEIIVQTPFKNYSASKLEEILKDTDFSPAVKIFNSVSKAWKEEAPGVRMFCFHGNKIKTVATLKYSKAIDTIKDNHLDIEYADGDGTVNLRSLQACTRWVGRQDEELTYQIFEGADHTDILKDEKLFQAIDSILAELNGDDMQLRSSPSDEL